MVQLVDSEQQLEIEAAAIEFFSSVISCHAKNQLTFALILCDVIHSQRNVIPGLFSALIIVFRLATSELPFHSHVAYMHIHEAFLVFHC